MNNLWYDFLVDKFVTNETQIRCCASCQGGCLNPAVCAFICCGIPVSEFKDYVKEHIDELREEFHNKYEYL